ncbi:MAG: phosphopyruvate hydratase [Thermoprotei archaeon]
MGNPYAIAKVRGFQIINSRGNPTLRVQIVTENGIQGFGDAPEGASRGEKEAVEIRDKDYSVRTAVDIVNAVVNETLRGFDVRNQVAIDETLIKLDGTENKSRIGGNVAIATSIAAVYAGSKAVGEEPFRYIGGARVRHIPVPLLNVINGGKHAGNELKIQEFIIIPVGFSTFQDAIEASTKVYRNLKKAITEKYGKIYTAVGDEGGFSPPLSKTRDALNLLMEAIKMTGYSEAEFKLGLDAASSEFFDPQKGTYKLDGQELTRDQLLEFYVSIANEYPLLYLEDPFNENDLQSFSELQRRIPKVVVTGDDLYTTNVKYLRKGIETKATRGVIVKPNQIGTVTETFEFAETAKANSIKTVVSHRSGETESSFVADLSVGLHSDFIKTGAPARGERTAKYNRLIEIEVLHDLKYLGEKVLS